MKKLCLLVVACAFSVITGSVGAQLFDGETVNFQYYHPNLSSPYSSEANGDYLVGPGVEINNIDADNMAKATMDISDTNIFIDYVSSISWSPTEFNGFVITDALSSIPDIKSVTIDPVTNMVGFDASRITFDDDHIRVNWGGLGANVYTVISLNVSTERILVPGCDEEDLIGTWMTYGVTGDVLNKAMPESIRCKIKFNSFGSIVRSASSCKFRSSSGVGKLEIADGDIVVNSKCVITGEFAFCEGIVCVGLVIEHGTLSTGKDVFSILGHLNKDPDMVFSLTGHKR